MELSNDAAETPEVDFAVIGHSKDDFGGAVIATLYVCVDSLIFKAA